MVLKISTNSITENKRFVCQIGNSKTNAKQEKRKMAERNRLNDACLCFLGLHFKSASSKDKT